MKKTIILFVLCFLSTFIVAQDFNSLFNDKLTQEEFQKIKNNELLIRNIGNSKKISINPVNDKLNNLLSKVKKMNPNYLAEIIKVIPRNENKDAIKNISEALQNIDGFTKIPYWSERQENWYDLYDSAVLNSIVTSNELKSIYFTVGMPPFGTISMDATLEQTDNSLLYTMINTNTVKYEYQNITCVKPEKMLCGITIFEYGDYYILYGTGSLNALSFLMLRDRIDTAFIGRIKYFCKYMFELTDLI